jgi:hypothetical protein
VEALAGELAALEFTEAASPSACPPSGPPARPLASSHAAGRNARHLIVTSSSPPALAAAARLAAVGGTLTLLGPGPLQLSAPLQLPSELRVVRTGGYHPDFIPEALAALRRDPALGSALRRADEGGSFERYTLI